MQVKLKVKCPHCDEEYDLDVYVPPGPVLTVDQAIAAQRVKRALKPYPFCHRDDCTNRCLADPNCCE